MHCIALHAHCTWRMEKEAAVVSLCKAAAELHLARRGRPARSCRPFAGSGSSSPSLSSHTCADFLSNGHGRATTSKSRYNNVCEPAR